MIQEATASEPLTLSEEYENQESWRISHDKLTFILCRPTEQPITASSVTAGEVDGPDRMIGDINFFLYPWEDDDADDAAIGDSPADKKRYCIGEIDIMIADKGERGRGVGRVAVASFLHYIYRNLHRILAEYRSRTNENAKLDDNRGLQLKLFMAKIKESNLASIALFKSLGFVQQQPANYFGEVTLALETSSSLVSAAPEGYREVAYTRPS